MRSRETTSARPSWRGRSIPLRPAVAVRGAQRRRSRRPRAAVRLAPREGGRPVLTGAATAVGSRREHRCELPLRAASRQRAKNVGLVTQSWGGWAVDVVKGAAIGSLFAAAGGARWCSAMRRFGRALVGAGAARWRASASSSPTSGRSCSTRCSTSSRRCPPATTRTDVLDLAERAGVDVGEVYSVDASRRTTAANAYVTGIGTRNGSCSRHAANDFTPAETRLVVAHELGHVHYRDVPHGLLWLALVAPFGTFAVARAGERLTRDGATAVPAVALRWPCSRPPSRRSPITLARDRAPRRRVRARADRRADGHARASSAGSTLQTSAIPTRRTGSRSCSARTPPRWSGSARPCEQAQ